MQKDLKRLNDYGDLIGQDQVNLALIKAKNLAGNPSMADKAMTIVEILSRKKFTDRLLVEDSFINSVLDFLSDKEDGFEELRRYCMSAFLEMTNEATLNEEGNLNIIVDENGITLSPELNEKEMLVRQAIAAQIERWAVFRANGIEKMTPKKILCIGAGTLIECVMLRDLFADAEIIAAEPGVISEKTRALALKKNINLVHGTIQDLSVENKFDLVVCHFVLEHDETENGTITKGIAARLNPDGAISIAVPNYDAMHRQIETAQNIGGRDQEKRISDHDRLRGHKIIYRMNEVRKLIADAIDNVEPIFGERLPVHTQTILPRPLSFANMCATPDGHGSWNHHKILEMELAGHLPGREDEGSVICMTVGHGLQQEPVKIDRTGKTKLLFESVLNGYF